MSDEESCSSSSEEEQFEEEHEEGAHGGAHGGGHLLLKQKGLMRVMGKSLLSQAKKNKKLGGMFGGFGKSKSANAEDGTVKEGTRKSFSGISSKFGGGSGGSLGGKFSNALNNMKGHPHSDTSTGPVNNNAPIGSTAPVENSAPVTKGPPPVPNH